MKLKQFQHFQLKDFYKETNILGQDITTESTKAIPAPAAASDSWNVWKKKLSSERRGKLTNRLHIEVQISELYKYTSKKRRTGRLGMLIPSLNALLSVISHFMSKPTRYFFF